MCQMQHWMIETKQAPKETRDDQNFVPPQKLLSQFFAMKQKHSTSEGTLICWQRIARIGKSKSYFNAISADYCTAFVHKEPL